MTTTATRSRRLAKLIGAMLICAVFGGLSAGPASAATGITSFSATPSDTQAGGHPDLEVSMTWLGRTTEPKDPCLCDNPRIIAVHAPTGFIGNPHNLPVCTLVEFNFDNCPEASQVGLAEIGDVFPVYNMQPHPDQPGLIAFLIPFTTTPAFIELTGRTDSDYGLDSVSAPIIQLLPLTQLDFTLWGVPADPVHKMFRFHTPLSELGSCTPPDIPVGGSQRCEEEIVTGAESPVPPAPYLQNPTTCGASLTAGFDLSYYNGVVDHAESPWPATTGCQQLAFNPSLTAVPTTSQADTAAGIDIDLKVPQLEAPYTPAASEIRSSTITLPAGFSINPNAADGKESCSDSQTAIGTLGAATCPEFAKVGTLSLDVAALPGPIDGAIYLGEPKPGERYRLIVTADGFGTHVKLPGSVHADPATGQLVSNFELPQSNLQEVSLHFFGSERGALATPSRCDTYPVESEFVPWDDALPTQHSVSYFTIDSGPNGRPCPGPSRPFAPTVHAGVKNNTAGAHSSFAFELTREDGDQLLRGLKVVTPPGFSATLKGVSYCSESAISRLAALGYSGLGELMFPACPAGSRIGSVTTGAGAGTHPIYIDGAAYLAGPYKGAPLSLVAVVPAVSGPYDLGVVAVRAAIYVDPITAQVTTISDALPLILEGIPLRARAIRVNLGRPNFALNPTNCSPFSVDSSVSGDEGGQSSTSNYFQIANCASLTYRPKLGLKLSGGVERRGHPAIHAVFSAGVGEANTKTVAVTLPQGELLDNSHFGTICSRVQFAAEACPSDSKVGAAEADSPLLDQPLTGSVYLLSSAHELPDLVVDLEGQFKLQLHGRVDSARGGAFRTTFESVPDAPVSTFTLDLAGGSKGLLQNSESLCGASKKATVRMVGQNGAVVKKKVKLRAACGAARHKRHRDSRGAKRKAVR